MTKEIIFLPAILMVLLTILVWGRMLIVRVSSMKSARVHPEMMKSQKAKDLLPEEANLPAENFANLFEVPILFYVLTAFLYVSEIVSIFYVALAFAYVVFRYIHSLVALSYNKVMHRFSAYIFSCIILWVLWGGFAYEIVNRFNQ